MLSQQFNKSPLRKSFLDSSIEIWGGGVNSQLLDNVKKRPFISTLKTHSLLKCFVPNGMVISKQCENNFAAVDDILSIASAFVHKMAV